ncbi:MAG: hypothetical protein R3C46_03955 [Hyphomonadaceae bacterium]
MSQKRNLGPILALTGGGIAIAAVIAGFIVIGGPDQTRDRRLDEMTEDRVADLVRTVQCAYFANGEAPDTIEQVSVSVTEWPRRLPIVCNRFDEIEARQSGRTAAEPIEPGDVTYQKVSKDSVRVCAIYRLPTIAAGKERQPRGRGDVLALFPALREDREKGAHCYSLQLKTAPNE